MNYTMHRLESDARELVKAVEENDNVMPNGSYHTAGILLRMVEQCSAAMQELCFIEPPSYVADCVKSRVDFEIADKVAIPRSELATLEAKANEFDRLCKAFNSKTLRGDNV